MNDATAQRARLAIRASDAEREQAVALLQCGFADGRLTLTELEERVGAAYAARTRARLRDLTADLPAAAADQQPRRPGLVLDWRLLCILLCVCGPPASLACQPRQHHICHVASSATTAGRSPVSESGTLTERATTLSQPLVS